MQAQYRASTTPGNWRERRDLGTLPISCFPASEPYDFAGLPTDRRDCVNPNSRAFVSTQDLLPKGRWRLTHSRSAANSAAVCGSLTYSTQLEGNLTGGCTKGNCAPSRARQRKLPQSQSSARATMPARNALRST